MSSLFPLNSIIFYLYGDDPPARCRRNPCMVEEGVHVVPTLRNRVVIFYFIEGKEIFEFVKIIQKS